MTQEIRNDQEDKDITKEEQQRYEQEQKRSAKTGKIRLLGVIAFDMATQLLYLFAGTVPLYIRVIAACVQALIAGYLIYGHNRTRVLFTVSGAVTMVRSAVLLSAVASKAVVPERSHGLIYFSCAMGIAGPLLYTYMMWFNPNIKNFFALKNTERKRQH